MVAYSFIGAVAVLSSMVSAAPMPQVDVQGAPAPAEPWVETPAQPAEPWVETPAQPPAEPWQAPPAEPWQAPPAEPWQAPPAPAEPWHAPPVEPWKTWEHGSGKAPWTNTDYDDCVQKCIAEHSPAPSEWKPSETVKEPVGPVGTGATHVVIVAPSQGVLRYVPYAIDAQVGDTVKFMWGANGHTVTQGSELLPCNKSDGGFTPSGLQDKDFVFTQVVNSTEPTYFYCAAQTHCSKGMFGIINPKKSAGSENSVEKLAPVMGETSEEANMWNVWSDAMTANNTKAAEWGNAIDMSAVPEEMRTYMLQNTAYTRSFLAANPETLSDDGKVTISGETPLIFPVDGVNALNNAAAASSNTEASGSASAAPSATDAAAPAESAPANDNGAGALASPKALIAVIVAVATFFAL